jgi:hypothetical protein
MALFAGRERSNLVRALGADVRLLLPSDPGRERFLEYVRLFDPRAQLASAGSINVDDAREVYLTRGLVIEPDVASEAGVPAGMTMAFFVSKTTRARPFSWSDVQQKNKDQYDASVRLVNGLAVRLGGIAWPGAPVLQEPLETRVYTSRAIGAWEVFEVIARYAQGLEPYPDPSFGPVGVASWQAGGGQLIARHFPPGTVSLLRPHSPPSIGDLWFRTSELTAVQLRLAMPAAGTDPGSARRLGQCALEVAGASGGPCVDQLGFLVRRPDELVFG